MYRSKRSYPEGCFDVEVKDNANAPELRRGDMVVVDPQAELSHGDFVYIEVRYQKALQRTIRRYLEYRASDIQLVPLNRNYRTYRFGASGEPRMAILGKVLELFRTLSGPDSWRAASKTA